jgi:hypothetical protein
MQALIYHGEDSSLIQEFKDIETHDEISKHMFVTLELGPEKVLWIRSVPLKDLSAFEGPLFQVDYETERDALILHQVQMRFWPWGRAAETLDELFREAFNDFYKSLSQSGGWFAKERDCVNRFVMDHLVPFCSPGSPLKHPTQIGMEVAVKMPAGLGSRLSSPKDVVIWDSPYGTCWSADMKPVRAPVAVLEWKCQRETGSKQNTDEDRAWLEAFCRESLGSTGYSVFLDLDAGGVLRELTCPL